VPPQIENTWTSGQPPPQPIQKFAVFAVTGLAFGPHRLRGDADHPLKEAGLPASPGYDLVTYDEHPSKERGDAAASRRRASTARW
jgi:hypothetical protein